MSNAPVLSPSSQPSARRFYTLDGIRGVAAMAMFYYHASEFNGLWGLHDVAVAVDLFFVLSGFVVAHAYTQRLTQGMGTWEFMRLRLARFYPLYLLGMLLYLPIPLYVAHVGVNPWHWTNGQIAFYLVLGVFMIPAFRGGALYPLLLPAWSLFFELLSNAGWAATLKWWDRRRLTRLAGLSAVVVAGITLWQGMEQLVGLDVYGVLTELSVVTYCFAMGVLIHGSDRSHIPRLPAWLVVLGALGVLALEVPPRWHGIAIVVKVLAVFPALIVLGSVTEPSGRWERSVYSLLGDTSYGVYIIQFGAYGLFRGWVRAKLHADLSRWAPWPVLALMVLFVAIVQVLDRVYDRPVRGWLLRVTRPMTRRGDPHT